MKRAISLLVALATAFGVSAAIPTTVGATGDCSFAAIFWYNGTGATGTSRLYCFDINDQDIESELPTTAVMGPLSNGTTLNDFDSFALQSGVNSTYYVEQTSIWRVCVYSGKNWTGTLLASLTTSGQNWNFSNSATPGSFRWMSTSCPAG